MAAAITAIVVNYNAGPVLMRCVRSVLSSGTSVELRVVDNGSSDGSIERLRNTTRPGSGLEILQNASNLGFGRAVNGAAAGVASDWLLVLNPDAVLEAGALAALRDALAADPGAAVAGGDVRDAHGTPEPAAVRRFPSTRRALMSALGLARLERWLPALQGVTVPISLRPTETTPVDAVSGACLLLRREAFEAVGGFDPGYALHCEDLDLMKRLSDAGWRCLYVPAAQVVHEKGVSSRSRPLWVHTQKHLGMLRYDRKFHPGGAHLPARAAVAVGAWLHWLLTLPWVWLRR